jgi:hypothetical protein
MDKELREKVAEFLEHTGVLKEARVNPGMMRRLGQMVGKAKGPALGVGAGAGGVMGLSALGQRDLETQQAAAEMQQLLQAYPELIYDIPPAAGYADPYGGGGGMGMGGGGMSMGGGMGMGGGGDQLPPELMMMLQQQQGGYGQ